MRSYFSSLVIFSMLSQIQAEMIPSVQDYFPELAGNLTKIEWLHAVNSQSRLVEGLADASIHFLEADVIYGKLKDGSGPMPIMGHPPSEVSDLSLEHFIKEVMEAQSYTKKAIKLDFKSDKAFNASWDVINALKSNITFPVWLNADILRGPVNATSVPLNPKNFVESSKNCLPSVPLSLGWTTAFEVDAGYSKENLDDMLQVVEEEKCAAPITLAVRAAFAAKTIEGLVKLIAEIDRYQGKKQTTLTVWMSDPKDTVDIPKLRELMDTITPKKFALDVPQNIRDQLLGSKNS